jgi:hypothetical protein
MLASCARVARVAHPGTIAAAGSARCGFSISAPYSAVVPMVPTSASTLTLAGRATGTTSRVSAKFCSSGRVEPVEHDARVALADALHNLLDARAVVQVEAGDDVAAADHRENQRDHILASGVGGLTP